MAPPETLAWGLVSALGLGIYTSITPCPLATNIAAISYIGRRVGNPRQVLYTGLLYAAGRTFAYTTLGFLVVAGLLVSSTASSFFRQYFNDLLGPILIIVSMFLLGLLEFGIAAPAMSDGLQKKVDALGIWGAFLLGIIFALSFCPISAGLFFLTLIPWAAYLDSRIGLPAIYGIGTALPVVAFAFIIAFSVKSLGKAFDRLTQIERWLRLATGGIFLAVGIYYTLRNIFELPLV
jgi:cytochrome c-type biogenesis protein